MTDDVFVGLDVHKNSVVATVLDRSGKKLDQTTLGSSDPELVAYLGSIPGSKHIALEACVVWEHVYDAAASTGAQVILAHPKKTRLIAEAAIKTDKYDSRALAELMRLNAIAPAFAPPMEIRLLRQMVRDRRYYKELQTSVKNHTYSFLLRRGIPYKVGLLNLPRRRERLRELKIPGVDRGLDMVKNLAATCKELDRDIQRVFEASKEAQLLETIPGIGVLSAVTLVAEICPIDRFATVERFCSYVGLVPSTRQSGDHEVHGHLMKDANRLAGTVLVEATFTNRKVEKRGDVAKLARRVGRKRGKIVGNVAGAHKLAKIVYAVLKRGTPYTPERPCRGTSSTGP